MEALGTANEPGVLSGSGTFTMNAVAHDASAGRHAKDVLIPHNFQSLAFSKAFLSTLTENGAAEKVGERGERNIHSPE